MYKVFVNDTPIIITSCSENKNNYLFFKFKSILFKDVLKKAKIKDIKGIILYSKDLKNDWKSFISNMEVILAAGGLVLNNKKEILFIYRNGVWDLPKGWIEKKETIESAAIREVEEECGIYNLKIVKPLVTTYHIYNQNGVKLKQTHWFLMTSDFNKELTPQLEEGITQVTFKNSVKTEIALKNTYENIKLVYYTFKEG
ncbi:MAG: NUDIX domain-containing protein [Polaribacter sp.]|uniref:NUDIX hydrolase n=1 Tax=Polaribacter sp. TaxID=1920175 RepID=UPI0032646D94